MQTVPLLMLGGTALETEFNICQVIREFSSQPHHI